MTGADEEARSSGLAGRLSQVRARIASAALRAGRSPGDVRLVVVTKSAPASVLPSLARLGVTDVGENRVQAGEGRVQAPFRWHLVGHLQANKARRAVQLFDVLHGIDSAELLSRVDRLAVETGRRPEVLLQVNVSGESTKHGVPSGALPGLMKVAAACRAARVVGLMTMAPADADAERCRPVFAALARLAREDPFGRLTQLSMGMSADFEVAVEEGATLVRVGRGIVGPSGAE